MILILGSDGLLGNALLKYYKSLDLRNVQGIGKSEFQVGQSIDSLLDLYKPSIVINCIGVVVQVIQKYDKNGVYDINSYFPRNLANDCNSRNIKMIHISTDCVFSGQNRLDVYSETSIPDSADLYGVSKHRGEPNNCLVVRTSFIGEEFRDSPRSLIGWAMSMKGTTVNGFTNHIWNGVTTLELGNFLLKLIQNNEVQNKLIHCLTPGFISKYELLLIYNKVYNLNLTITPTRAPVTINRMLSSIYLYSKKYVTLDYEEQAYYLKEFYDKLGRGKA